MSKRDVISAIDSIIREGKSKGIIHLNASEVKGSRLVVRGRPLINFGSCSYLGLEFDQRLIQGSQQAVERFGTQFSASRAYISCGLYQELEEIFKEIFQAHVMIAPTTTLGHIATIPVIVGEKDAVIVDHQVHASVQGAVELVKTKGTHVELVRHNRMDMLEERIAMLQKYHDKVWYMADGVYSMFGDKAPVKDIERLLNTYENFHFYVDDAHGMSCYGQRGEGYVLSKIELHPRMVLAISLAKAFATGGSVFVFPDEETAELVRNCGGPMITSGPMQPGALGAAVASGRIHLSDEYPDLRDDLQHKIAFTNRRLLEEGLPLVAENDSPVFFIGCGLPKVGYTLVERMNKKGYMTNLGVFPAVPMKNTGLRFTITRLNDEEEIDRMVTTLAGQHHIALKDEGYDLRKVQVAFKMKPSVRRTEVEEFIERFKSEVDMDVSHVNSINELNAEEWDSIHANAATFDAKGLLKLEGVFKNQPLKENNWAWDYIHIKDGQGRVVLSTYLTTSLQKDDFLADQSVSQIVEKQRHLDKYMLTSLLLSTGCPLSVGEHLFIDFEHMYWRKAFHVLQQKIDDIVQERNIDSVMLRDLNSEQDQLNRVINESGFMRVQLPEDHVIDLSGVSSDEEFLNSLSSKSRRHVRREVLRYVDEVEVRYQEYIEVEKANEYYQMYLNVKKDKLEINTFDLPLNLFELIATDPNWDKTEILSKNSGDILGIALSYKTATSYTLAFIGIGQKEEAFSVYRQCLYHSILRAIELGKTKINLEFTASIEKMRLGAKSIQTHAYFQAKEHFSMQVIENIKVNRKTSRVE
jgi:7-keto-8-aminopelargonate synthetase-like enzyme/predicted N-acyltransferase